MAKQNDYASRGALRDLSRLPEELKQLERRAAYRVQVSRALQQLAREVDARELGRESGRRLEYEPADAEAALV